MNIKKNSLNPWLNIGLFLCLLTIISCGSNERKDIPDVSEVQVKLNVQRFEQELFNLDSNNLQTEVQALNEKYGYFADLYFSEIMRFKPLHDSAFDYLNTVNGFINYPSIRTLYDTCQLVYGDFSEVEKDLTSAFQFYKYHFPEKPIPKITTFISEYGVAIASVDETEVVIGLDMFLGADYQPYYYPPVQLPNYITQTLDQKHITPKVMEALARDIVGVNEKNRLIDFMVHNGKALYLLDLFQPYIEDNLRLGITPKQSDWLYANEAEMWKTVFIDNLYETKLKKNGLLGLVEVAPTSPGMPRESPGNAGSWVGWQIVKGYMENNPNMTLKQLLQEKDAQKILQGSSYRPR
ncbi:MAG: hypothetical protein ACJAUH_002662 [Saprospiraceae bacterium]|jgi:hypothetical protein|tara:strand:+ start:1278 stop:2330 length:1053 start_codon:yes stop_codon:yes gene_type:complete